jgi:hypothetical protein
MDPVTLAILTGVGGQALSQVGTLIPTEIERSQKRELERLKKLQGKGQLGLSEKEQAAMQGKLSVGSTQVQQQAADERNRILAGGGSVTGGQALQQAVAVDAQRAQGQERIAQAILEQDLIREQAQKDRIGAIEAAQSQKRAERASAAASIAGAGLEAFPAAKAASLQMQSAKAPSAGMIAATKQAYGLTGETADDEARGIIELQYNDPEAAKMLGESLLAKAKAGAK